MSCPRVCVGAHPANRLKNFVVVFDDVSEEDRLMVGNPVPDSPDRVKPTVNGKPRTTASYPEASMEGLSPERLVVP